MFDPFEGCEIDYNHDLAQGVTLEELLGSDGPHLPVEIVRVIGWRAAVVRSGEAA